MLAFPSMLIPAAEQAGMPIPDLSVKDEYNQDDFPHFAVFCAVQLGRAMDWDEPWENAKVIATIPKDKIKSVTLDELITAGLRWRS